MEDNNGKNDHKEEDRHKDNLDTQKNNDKDNQNKGNQMYIVSSSIIDFICSLQEVKQSLVCRTLIRLDL